MNYEFWFDGAPYGEDDIPIGQITREEWQRPQVGSQIKINGRIYLVTRTSPAGNPSGQKIKYFVDPINTNWPYRQKR